MKLKNKVALVVGAGSIGKGIGNGRAISILFTREGAKVACADINLESAKETVNVVGIGRGIGIMNTDENEWDEVMRVNLKSVFLMSKFAVPEMIRAGGGAIINISSAAGLSAHPSIAYAVSKAGVIHMTRCMAVELAGYNIRVNCIAPGFLDTPMVAPLMTDERRKIIEYLVPLKRIGNAWDTANAALYLASSDANYVTGITLVVDGGVTASGAWRGEKFI